MYIQYTFVHFTILLIRQILGAVPLPVTSPFVVEALSLRLRTRLGLLHLSSNLLAVLLEVPLLSLCPFLETSGLVNHQHLMLFLDFYFRSFEHSCSDPTSNVKSLCFSVIPGSVMLTHTILEGFIIEWQSHTYYIECLKREFITINMAYGHLIRKQRKTRKIK